MTRHQSHARSRPARCALGAAAAITLLAALTGCEDAVTMENFEQIEIGMTMSQVESILGGRGEDQTSSGVGIGATGVESQQATQSVYVWSKENRQIIVTFRNGEVYGMRHMGLD